MENVLLEESLLNMNFSCGICKRLMYDPCITPCRCSYCRECIRMCLCQDRFCPGSRQECKFRSIRYPEDILPHNLITDIMEGVIAQCPHTTTKLAACHVNISEHFRVCEYCRRKLVPGENPVRDEGGTLFFTVMNQLEHFGNEIGLIKRRVSEQPKRGRQPPRKCNAWKWFWMIVPILIVVIIFLCVLLYLNHHHLKEQTKHVTAKLEGQLKDYKITNLEGTKLKSEEDIRNKENKIKTLVTDLGSLKSLMQSKMAEKENEIKKLKEHFQRTERSLQERLAESEKRFKGAKEALKVMKEELKKVADKSQSLAEESYKRVSGLQRLVDNKEAVLARLKQDLQTEKSKDCPGWKNSLCIQYSAKTIMVSLALFSAYFLILQW